MFASSAFSGSGSSSCSFELAREWCCENEDDVVEWWLLCGLVSCCFDENAPPFRPVRNAGPPIYLSSQQPATTFAITISSSITSS